MNPDSFLMLAGIIASHHNRQVQGRTRLQRTVWLLQRIGFPTDYQFSLFFGGPYSGGVGYDLRFLKRRNMLTETQVGDQPDEPIFLIEAPDEPIPPEISPFRWAITRLEQADEIVLELAASYDVFRELGYSHEAALQGMRRKTDKWTPEGEKAALELLKALHLPTDEPVPESAS
jgi:uncharacterized protein YwgA